MKNVLPNQLFFNQVEQFIAAGQSVRIPLKGYSMRPLIPNGYVVELQPCRPEEVQPGSVVLFRYRNGHVLHRVIRRTDNQLLLQGDGNIGKQEKADIADVIAIVRTVSSPSGHTCSTDSRSWRIRSFWWVKLRPIRRYLLAIYNRLPQR